MFDSDWLEVNDEEPHVTIHGNGFTATITKFATSDWQIDFETDNGAGTYGKVESKEDALSYIFEKAGIIENSGVSPRKVVIT